MRWAELDLGELELALALDEALVRTVDHDVADGRVGEQLFERPEAEKLVDEHLLERELLAAIERDLQLGEDFADDRASSSLLRVAAASGSTRSSRRGRTCSLIR